MLGDSAIPALSLSSGLPPKPFMNKWTFTPKFQEVLDSIKKYSEEPGVTEEQLRNFFKEKMLEVGWQERIRNLYSIRDKLSGKFVQFKPNKAQEVFIETRSGHDAILKCRQVGFTTFSCIYALDRALFDKWRTGLMAHKQETVKVIFDIVKQAYQAYIRRWGFFFKPTEENNNTTRLSWSDTKSSLTVAFDFQGFTVNFLHVSEAAFISTDRLTNSLQAIPETGEVILESTPNGRGGFFYDIWEEWRNSPQQAHYKGYFVPWFVHYPEVVGNWDKPMPEKLTSSELELIKNYDLKNYHILWRRYKIKGDCGGDEETFGRQYPTDDVSCFLSGESNVIPTSVLKEQEKFIQDPRHTGYLRLDGKKVLLERDPKGPLKIYKLPTPTGVYAIGADPSGGHGKDPGCAIVVDYATGEQAAELHGFFDPDSFADQLYMLGQFYNQAFQCIETNNHGYAVILKLKDRYFNLYKKQTFNKVIQTTDANEYGFLTTSSSKITITDNFAAALRDAAFRVRSNALLSELSRFVNVVRKSSDGRYLQTNKREALPGSHDDRVIAACLAWEMVRSRPVLFTKETQPSDQLQFDPDTGFPITTQNDYSEFYL